MYQLRWLFDRWRIMQHPYEEIYRVNQQIQYHWRDKKWAKNPPLKHNFRWKYLLKEYYSRDDISRIVHQSFGNIYVFKLLNTVIDDIVHHTNWNYDAKNKMVCKSRFVHEINDFDYSQGEVKYIYELSRLYQLVPLVANYIANNDIDGIGKLKCTLKEWYKQNPFLYNVAWKSGNVVGIRAINLIVFKSLLDLVDDDRSFSVFFNDLIELHYRFLKSHLSLYSSKGNHHVGELAGLIAITASFDFEHSKQDLEACFQELQEEVLRLIHKDGFNKEQATRYQASYLNLFMMSFLFCQRTGLIWKNEVKERIENAYSFLSDMKVSNGVFIHVGDNDDAQLIYPYPDGSFDIYESMLNDFGVLFGKRVEDNYHFDLRNYVLLGMEGFTRYFSCKRTVPRKSTKMTLYNDSGYFRYSDDKIDLLFDVGQIGLLPTMSHGHSDILSFQFYYERNPILVDTGSYQYNIKYRRLRDYFHGVHSHNTIAVEGKDQAILGTGMFWMSNPNVHIEAYSAERNMVYCTAWHDGYVRKGMNVLHKRNIRIEEKQVCIEDSIKGQGGLRAFFYLHFYPSVRVNHVYDELMIEVGQTKNIVIKNHLFHEGKLIKGDVKSSLGWFSPSYDKVVETNTFVLEIDLSVVNELKTIINYK
ncbi:alginate lyase family protein [Butyricimonas sp. GBGM4]